MHNCNVKTYCTITISQHYTTQENMYRQIIILLHKPMTDILTFIESLWPACVVLESSKEHHVCVCVCVCVCLSLKDMSDHRMLF